MRSGHESKVINALRFLGLVDESGQPTDNVSLLNSEGETFKGNLTQIVQAAYSDLLATVRVKDVKPELVHQYFTDPKRSALTLSQAKEATKFFVWLAREAGLELSSELATLGAKPGRKPRETKLKETGPREEEPGEIATPKTVQTAVPGASLEEVNKAIRGLYAANPKAVKYSALATQVDLYPTSASAALNTAKDLGLAKVTTGAGRGAYVLTTKGLDYGLHLQTQNQEQLTQTLREAILASEMWREAVTFLRANVGKSRAVVDLSSHVAGKLSKAWGATALKHYGQNYAQILEAAGLVQYDKASSTLTTDESVQIERVEGGEGEEKRPKDGEKKGAIDVERGTIVFPININVTIEANDAEALSNLTELLRTISQLGKLKIESRTRQIDAS